MSWFQFQVTAKYDVQYADQRLHNIADRHESKKSKVGDAVPQDKVLARIKSSATLSLGRIKHSNFCGCLQKKNPTLSQLQEAVMMGRWWLGQDSHDSPPSRSRSHRGLDGDFMAILVFCSRHIEYGEDWRGENENCSINKVTSRTDSLADAKY